jgi:hypothetical protein
MWPIAQLRLRTPGVALRPVGEADLDPLGELLPADVGLDPLIPQPFGLPTPEARAVALRQEYLRDLATWTPIDWTLPLLVETPDGLAGVQTLEGRRTDGELTIETASWLVTEQRGRGIGTAMRHTPSSASASTHSARSRRSVRPGPPTWDHAASHAPSATQRPEPPMPSEETARATWSRCD